MSSEENVTLATKFSRQDETLGWAVLVDFLLFLVVTLVYVVAQKYVHDFFYLNPLRRSRGPPVPSGAFGWVRVVLRITDADLIRHAGLDAYAFLVFIRAMLSVLVSFACTFGLFEVITNIACSFAVDDRFFPAGWSPRLSVGNVPKTDQEGGCSHGTLVVNMVGMLALTLYTVFFLHKAWMKVLAARHAFVSAARDASSRVVLVKTGPLSPVLTREHAMEMWGELYPGEVLDVLMVKDSGALHSLQEKHERLREQIELEVWTKPACCAKRGETLTPKQVQKKEKLLASKKELDEKLRLELQKYTAADNDSGRNYLVLFSSLRAANAAKQVVHTPEAWEVIAAPLPRDVRYNALQPSVSLIAAGTKQTCRAIYLAMLFLYLIPIAAISSLTNVAELEENVPFVRDILDFLGPQISAFLTAFLPTVATLVFFAILPTICLLLSRAEGWASGSVVMLHAFEKLLFFQFSWGFIGLAVGSTVFALVSIVESLADSPTRALTEIAGTLANMSNFFFSFLLIQAAFAIPFSEMKLGPCLIYRAKKTLAKRKADKTSTAVQLPPVKALDPKYHQWWGKVLFGFTVGCCYANIQLLTALSAIVYLSICYIVYSRQLLFFNTNEAEGCARHFFPAASRWVLIILFLSQFMLFVLHLTKESFATAVLCLACSVITYLAHSRFSRVYRKQLDVLPLLFSVRADDAIRKGTSTRETEEERAAFTILYGAQLGAALTEDGEQQGNKQLVHAFRELYAQKELVWPADLREELEVCMA
ncbi:hypothetical protein AB1Y20_001895 [Prymnesium parvum]